MPMTIRACGSGRASCDLDPGVRSQRPAPDAPGRAAAMGRRSPAGGGDAARRRLGRAPDASGTRRTKKRPGATTLPAPRVACARNKLCSSPFKSGLRRLLRIPPLSRSPRDAIAGASAPPLGFPQSARNCGAHSPVSGGANSTTTSRSSVMSVKRCSTCLATNAIEPASTGCPVPSI